jgi:secreted trypsin-like serine protease
MPDEVPWNRETRAVLVGVVSFGPFPCVNPAQPVVFTRIGYFMSWVLDNIKP